MPVFPKPRSSPGSAALGGTSETTSTQPSPPPYIESFSHGNKSHHDREHFLRCWHLTGCNDCLGKESDCSWCPFSWTCVPNSNKVPFLAPAWDENICPHWAERWELRTRPLGCQVSTITTLTSLVTIACTLLAVAIGFAVIFGIRRMWRWCRSKASSWRTPKGSNIDGDGSEGGTAAAAAGPAGGASGGQGSATAAAEPGSSGSGGEERMTGLISRLRKQKSQDEAARSALLGKNNAAREREPLLGAARNPTQTPQGNR